MCGNLTKETLDYIWFKSKEMNYLRQLKKSDIKKCLHCQDRDFCSPCLGRFANESKTGNPLEVATHFCRVAHVNRLAVEEYMKKA